MFPSRPTSLSRRTPLRPSQKPTDSELDEKAEPFGSHFLIRSSTPSAISSRAALGRTSEGTSYHRARLVFCPYARVWGAICTSAPLRASTELSPGFTLRRYRSPGFWSHDRDSGPFIGPRPLRLRRCGPLVSLRVRASNPYPRHDHGLPGSFSKTNGATLVARPRTTALPRIPSDGR